MTRKVDLISDDIELDHFDYEDFTVEVEEDDGDELKSSAPKTERKRPRTCVEMFKAP